MSTPPPWAARPDASMTLINEMMHRPLDPSYAAEAERRRSQGLPPAVANPLRLAVVALVIGLLLATAARTLRQPKDVVAGQRSVLVAQIRTQQQAGDDLARRQRALTAEVAAQQAAALAGQSRADLARRLAQAQVLAGTTAVTGPGIEVTLDNSTRGAAGGSNSDPRAPTAQDQGVVQSRDLSIVVNALWASGAEAISVNGQRLTSTSAIRFAGEAILVDYRPLARPYVVTAIGDGATVENAFTHSDGGVYAQGLADTYGVVYRHTRKDSLSCPAGAAATLRHAAAPSSAGSPAVPPSPAAPATGTADPSDNPSETETSP